MDAAKRPRPQVNQLGSVNLCTAPRPGSSLVGPHETPRIFQQDFGCHLQRPEKCVRLGIVPFGDLRSFEFEKLESQKAVGRPAAVLL